ncbi:amidohydrolase family protein [Sphingomonas sp.]|jgi:cytosine/adenosine deaminase-related metal-dependent hydrolase|uniref:amidohydrolase family protein n=1 Tax=Sphingomonas sp. TaxID=28214 RepID=UPI002E2EEA92|nr:amidohydrolase family protein [Sphingomonas sp.]HEX4695434.1 amidohydrolase family protein [Sphingomonas sp.]
MLVNARNRSVAIEGERIVEPVGAFDMVIDCRDADVRPGLINAHEHLHRNHYGRMGGTTYRNASHWAEDIQVRHRHRVADGRRMPRRDALLTGAWKNLFAGVTSVVHHDPWEAEFDRDFPLRVVRVANDDSLGMTPALGRIAGASPFSLHVAEGLDDASADEVRTLEARGLLTADLIAVHGVGMDADAVSRFRGSGAALVWCPSSNLFLFGRTAPRALLDEGVDVLLGSDSLLTGEGDLLDELRCARAIGGLSDARLDAAVGSIAARRLGLEEPGLDPGARADLILIGRPVIDASANDVRLVIARGVPRLARADIAAQFGPIAERGAQMTIGTVTRWTSAEPPQTGRNS